MVSLKWLKDYLLSTDLSRMDELDWVEKDEFRFLDQKENLQATGDAVMFQSFARSGNTFLRRFLE